MSKKKKKSLSEELLDLKMEEGEDVQLDASSFDMDAISVALPKPKDGKTQVGGKDKDKTIRLVHTSTGQLPPTPEEKKQSAIEIKNEPKDYQEEVKVSYGLPTKQQVPKAPELNYGSSEDQLKNSEHLRIAQRKINDLEDELIKLRRESEDLASAGETYKKLNDEYYAEIENLKSKIFDQKQTFTQEIKLLKRIDQNKDKQISEFKQQIDEFKSRIDNNFQRVRKREKDLEHRLEIAKMEEAAIIKSKDQLILDLKRRVDEISHESDNFRKKSQENYRELQKKQQVVRGVVRALRIALTKLEGDDDSDFGVDGSDGRGGNE